MTFNEFHNGLRILMNIDGPDLRGIVPAERMREFMDNPHRFFIRCDAETAQRLWKIVKDRQPHVHVAEYDGNTLLDRCGKCGRDLRDPIHERVKQ